VVPKVADNIDAIADLWCSNRAPTELFVVRLMGKILTFLEFGRSPINYLCFMHSF
jgi:hypothetical protein